MPWRRPERSDRLQARPAAATVLGGVLIVLASWTFGSTPLLVPGAGFILLGLLTPAWIAMAARSGHVRRHLDVHRVSEDEPFVSVIEIRRGPFGLPGAEIVDPLAGTRLPVEDAVSFFTGRPRLRIRVTGRLPRRGRHVFPPPSLELSDALGLARVCHPGTGTGDEMLVLPSTQPVPWLRSGHRRQATGRSAVSLLGATGSGEVDGLRAYMPGTPASRIHWPALARGAGLLERRLVTEPVSHPLVVLDSRVDDPEADESRLDASVRAAASITLELARRGGCSLLLPGSRVPTDIASDLVAWPAMHVRLALVEAEPDLHRAPALRGNLAQGALIYVTARLDPATLIPAGAARSRPLLLIVPEDLAQRIGPSPSFSVSGCAGYLLRSRAESRRRPAA